MAQQNIADVLAEEAEAAEAERDAPQTYVRHRRPAKDPAQVFSLRIPVNRLGQLRKLAESRHSTPSALLRAWILERLEAESTGAVTMTRDDVRKMAKEELERVLAARMPEIEAKLQRSAERKGGSGTTPTRGATP